jgi:hypothetical protein
VEDGLLSGLIQVTEKVSGGDLQHMDFPAFLSETFGFIRTNWADFRTLLVIQPSMRFVAKWKDVIKTNFARRYPKVRAHQQWELLSEMAASATIGAYTWWMERPDAAGIEQAKRVIERAIDAIVASL